MSARLQAAWYDRRAAAGTLLLPLAWLFCAVAWLRRGAYRLLRLGTALEVPVVVVGNLTVGGTGKTPLVIWLARRLRAAGYRPGIVSRGYGGQAGHWPQQVRPDSAPETVGDEPVVIARHTGCPMAVGPDRVAAARALLAHSDCNLIISDDGLQHYRLRRDVEIVVIDGVRRFGNRRCLPAGPLREPLSRLHSVDLLVANGAAAGREHAMRLEGECLYGVADGAPGPSLRELQAQAVHAVAGVGNPQRFFDALRRYGLRVEPHPMPDHHRYTATDLDFGDALPVIMTEKDAVKCRHLASGATTCWYLPVEAVLPPEFADQLLQLLERKDHG